MQRLPVAEEKHCLFTKSGTQYSNVIYLKRRKVNVILSEHKALIVVEEQTRRAAGITFYDPNKLTPKDK